MKILQTSYFKILLIIFLLLENLLCLAALPPTEPEEVGFSSERLERLSNVLNAYVEDEKLAGGVVLIARHGKVAYHEAFGYIDKEAATPMPKDAIFRIASQTKAIVSVGVMMLQEEGKILISDPVGNYLPEFKETTVAVPNDKNGFDIVLAKREITIRDLLAQTAGIGYGEGIASEIWKEAGFQGWYFANRKETMSEAITRLAKLPNEAHPGEAYVYGYATDILGVLIEKVSGQKLKDFLNDKILQPLKMQDTHFFLPQEKKDRLATVYTTNKDGTIERAPNPGLRVGQGHYLEGPRMCFSGGAGLLSTASDYSRFLQMLLNSGNLDGVQILSRHSIASMTRNHLGEIEFPWHDGIGFGLGFAIDLDLGESGLLGSVGRYGWGGAYHTLYWVDPEEDLIVVYQTQLFPTELDDHDKVRVLVYQALVGE